MIQTTEIKTNLRTGIKELILSNGDKLFFHYANNSGRGANNVTITRCMSYVKRPRRTTDFYCNEIITQAKTSSWKGSVNYSRNVHDILFRADG